MIKVSPRMRGPDCILTMVSNMAPLPERPTMCPPASMLSWTEYPFGIGGGTGAGAAGSWATAIHAAASNMATSIPRNNAKDGC